VVLLRSRDQGHRSEIITDITDNTTKQAKNAFREHVFFACFLFIKGL